MHNLLADQTGLGMYEVSPCRDVTDTAFVPALMKRAADAKAFWSA